MKKKLEPTVKVVIAPDTHPESLPNYECVNCDFHSFLEDKAIAHQQETKKGGKMHEMWVKRR